MFIIGIDPHRGSHTATVLDGAEEVLDELRVSADGRQRDRLLDWAAAFVPRLWAVEGATGTGALLAQQLVAAGERVVDVPPTLSARVRLLDSGRSDKTDSHDARSAAVVALRHQSLRQVQAQDHLAVLRLLAKRHHDLIAARTRAVCRLHTTLCHLAEGHFPKRMTTSQGAAILARIRPRDAVSIERKALARDLLAEMRRADRDIAELLTRIKTAVAASGLDGHADPRRRSRRRHLSPRAHRSRSPASRAPGTTPATTAPPPSKPPADPPNGTGSTPVATGSSTTPSTWPR